MFLYQDHRVKKLPDQFTNVCWDGTQLLLLAEESGSIYSYHEDQFVPVFQTEPLNPYNLESVFLASERWVVVSAGISGTHVFDRELGKLVTYDLDIMRGCHDAFLYHDALFVIGSYEGKDSITLLDLASSEKKELEIGVVPTFEGYANFSAATNPDGSVLYLSMRADWPLYFEIEDQTTTVAIDLETMSIEKLSDAFYSGLFIKDGKLYGTKPKTGIAIRLQ